jgi:hypothetical protein
MVRIAIQLTDDFAARNDGRSIAFASAERFAFFIEQLADRCPDQLYHKSALVADRSGNHAAYVIHGVADLNELRHALGLGAGQKLYSFCRVCRFAVSRLAVPNFGQRLLAPLEIGAQLVEAFRCESALLGDQIHSSQPLEVVHRYHHEVEFIHAIAFGARSTQLAHRRILSATLSV